MTIKPTNRPSIVFKKTNGVYEECFIDNENVFEGWTKLTPLEPNIPEKEPMDTMELNKRIAHTIATKFGVSKKLEPLDVEKLFDFVRDFWKDYDLDIGVHNNAHQYDLVKAIGAKFGVDKKLESTIKEIMKIIENDLVGKSVIENWFPNIIK